MNERIGYPELIKNSVELSKEYDGVSNIFTIFFYINVHLMSYPKNVM